MKSRTLLFLLAIAILAFVRIFSGIARRRGQTFGESPVASVSWSRSQLLIASFLTLFAELAFIRWIAVEIRVFAYFKNLALLLCFVGFGLGCALARQQIRWRTSLNSLLGLLLVVRLPWRSGKVLEGISQTLGGAADLELWTSTGVWNWVNFVCVALLTAILLLMLVWIFVPLGQVVGRQMDLCPKALSAYSWNLFAGLFGILIFFAVSRMMLPPWIWLAVILAGFALLQTSAGDRAFMFSLVVPAVLLLYEPASADRYTIWTPYQEIEYSRVYAQNGDFALGIVKVNHTGYQAIVNLSDEFLARHPSLLREDAGDNPYNVPFRFLGGSPSVLIVGSGTGNDVAAALRHRSSLVDAVEIDPAILALGRREHPEHPYDSGLVSVHLDDARAFLKRTHQRYDLILFGLLDSHTQFSDYSNMRLDNFVYTMESLREARERLIPGGVLFLKFAVDRPWMGRRLFEMLQQTFGKAPLVFFAGSSYTPGAMCFAVSPSARVDDALRSDGRLSTFVTQNHFVTNSDDVPVATDDWPYLYQRDRTIPRTFLSVGLLVIFISLGLYTRIPDARHHVPSLFYFSMGAGFMLLETQLISRLALYFGTTWQVNAIVISILFVVLLIANQIVIMSKPLPQMWIAPLLLLGLIAAWRFPIDRISGAPAFPGTLLAVVFFIPVIFAGLLFSTEFREETCPGTALGANMLGAVGGGLAENLSLLFGMRALLPVTIGIYFIAGAALWLRHRRNSPVLSDII